MEGALVDRATLESALVDGTALQSALVNGTAHQGALVDRAAAEDATAEAFIKVHTAWAEGRVEQFFPYARQTLVNHVIGQARRQQVANRYLRRETADGRGSRGTEEHVVDSDATFALLQKLPVGQRTAVVLRFYEDLPYDRIAAAVGVSVGGPNDIAAAKDALAASA